jgi:hypothetical protein
MRGGEEWMRRWGGEGLWYCIGIRRRREGRGGKEERRERRKRGKTGIELL